ncbi:universal stress protein [Sediminibacterium sp.]|uniref:universal stress protein n=1 Tax=Sediminibacterium sp. TaxID=1917865 RepID=UPI002716F76C|nr:universal stress protein [Sediminibacterium sp.]MDO9000396.1 universal stress protein [Bacteroidota bacterium]MDP3147035.1 universal stress protein [Bacteroidota bacterium]MDP3567429.1 universal stress protein [Sediminibacterium sp.]
MKKSRTKPKLTATKIKRILVPFDFSEHSSNALRQAIFMAKCFTAEIDLLHVVAPVYATPTYAGLMPVNDAFYDKQIKNINNSLKKIATDASTKEGVTINYKASLNVIHREILDYAKKRKTDLIIMGTHGVSGVVEFFAGSNAFRVVSESKCPVITVQKRSAAKGFKKIILPVRSELNSRQKVNLVATLAKTFNAEIYVVGYVENSDKTEKTKVVSYVKQVVNFLKQESISHQTSIITDSNFTKAILKLANEQKADLVAVMTSHDFSLDQIFSGTYSQQFVNHSKIPVLSIPNTLEFEYSYANPLTGGMTA